MKFSYNWIRELVPGLDMDARRLVREITMKTAECENVVEVGALLEGASVARVVSVEPMDGSRNQKAVVETERYGVKTVVCGAPNCRAGMLSIYVPLATAVIHGIASEGMLASGAELGVNRDHAGIVEIEQLDTRLIPDAVIEVDNKSLTHRPDLWGHHGMAREVAAITKKPLLDPVDATLLPDGPAAIEVEIEDLALCPRYSALMFENVTVRPSPLWLQYRLESIGLNPINNIVDVTNYVMAELAQPMHAFDADRLRGGTIYVRRAQAEERIVALNDETYTLAPSNLVIADAGGPVAIAGVIGGSESAIHEGATRIVLESANFQAAGVRKTSVQLKLRTDASMRFEKSQDPVNTTRGLARAIGLLREVSPGIRLVGGLADRRADWKPAPAIDLPVEWVSRKLGRKTMEVEIRGILEALAFGVVQKAPGHLVVSVPSWRATKDVSIKDDLLEEVGRMIGYDSIAPRPPRIAATPPPDTPDRLFLRRIRALTAAQGFAEVYNYSFVNAAMARDFGFDAEAHVRVENPIASDQELLRVSLLPGLRKNLIENSRRLASFRLFEIGREIHPRAGQLPDEITHLAAAIYSRDDGAAGLFEVKRLAECLMPGCRLEPAIALPYEHPERAAVVEWRGGDVGRLFELHPSMGVEGRAAILDIDLSKLRELEPGEAKYQPLRRFPTSAFDLSVVADAREPVGAIEKQLAAAAGDGLVEIEFVREYHGPPLAKGHKSISYRLTIGAADRTLSSEEVGALRERVIDAMRAAGYELRV
jgi:phenylalanyl-tRNA synthetase beta chain